MGCYEQHKSKRSLCLGKVRGVGQADRLPGTRKSLQQSYHLNRKEKETLGYLYLKDYEFLEINRSRSLRVKVLLT